MSPRDSLRRYPLFAALGVPFLDRWIEQAEMMNVQRGQTLMQAGQRGEHVYLMCSGRVRALRPGVAREIPMGNFEPGDLFGDYALLPPSKYASTCRVSDPGQILRLALPPVRTAIAGIPPLSGNLKNWLRLNALVGYLRGKSFLAFIAATSVLPLQNRCTEVVFPVGRSIQAVGLSMDRWFFICAGQVELEEAGSPRVLGAGDCFGELALLGQTGLARATARTEVSCLSLAAADFAMPLSGKSVSVQQTALTSRLTSKCLFDWLAQRDANDCGPAALTMAARALGVDTTLEKVRSLMRICTNGCNLLDLADAAHRIGLQATAVRIGSSQLYSVSLPAVAHMRNGHYATLFTWCPEGLLVGDPAQGVQNLTQSAFAQRWSGNLLLLAPAKAG